MKKPLQRPVNTSVLQQHLEEAAFYWLRREDAIWGPAFQPADVGQIDRLVKSHLNGINLAGPAAIAPMMKNLERWNSHDEAFVATYVLLHQDSQESLSELERAIIKNPELGKGAAAAMFWAGPAINKDTLKRWWDSQETSLMRSVLPALIAYSVQRKSIVARAIEHESPSIRSRAIRAVGEWNLTDCRSLARSAGEDNVAECRFEAAAALYLMEQVSPVERIRDVLQELEPPKKYRALMYWAAMSTDEVFIDWLEEALADKKQCRDGLLAIAFRGDPKGFLYITEFLNRERETKMAAYALSHITGLDLDEANLFKIATEKEEPETEENVQLPEPSALGDDNSDDDPFIDGLLEPDIDKTMSWILANASEFKIGQRILGGRVISDTAKEIFDSGFQPQRWQAAAFLTRHNDQAGCLAMIPKQQLNNK